MDIMSILTSEYFVASLLADGILAIAFYFITKRKKKRS
jgi:hypothetical protein